MDLIVLDSEKSDKVCPGGHPRQKEVGATFRDFQVLL